MQPEITTDHAEEETVLSEALDRRAADRARRKRRRFALLGIVPLVLLLAANLALAVGLSRVRGELDEVRAEAAPELDSQPAAANGDVEALAASVEELQQALREGDEEARPSAPASLERDVEQLRDDLREARAESRCVASSLRRLDTTLRRLLTRNIDPQRYVDGPPLPEC